MKAKLIAVGVAVVLVAGGGAFAALRFLGAPAEDAALALVPEDAVFYGNLFIDPSMDQKRALEGLAGRFPEVGSARNVQKGAAKLLEDPVSEAGLSFEGDVAPWLGNQAALFLLGGSGGELQQPSGAALVATTDIDATRAAIDKALAAQDPAIETTTETYEGVDYQLESDADTDQGAYGYVGDFLVVGDRAGFEAVVDTSQGGPTLGDSEAFAGTVGGLNGDRIALAYFNSGAVLDAVEEGGDLNASDREAIAGARELGGDQPSASALFARSDALILESSYVLPEEGPLAELSTSLAAPGLVPELPGEAWLAFGFPNSGETITTLLDALEGLGSSEDAGTPSEAFEAGTGLSLQDDFLSWMGDAGLFVRGTNFQELSGGAAVVSTDPARTIETVQKLGDLLVGQGTPVEPATRAGGYEGFSVQIPGSPAPVYVLGGPRLVIAYGEGATDDLVAPTDALADADRYVKAVATLGDGFATSTYVDIPAVLDLVDSLSGLTGETSPTYEEDVKPNLEPLSHLITGVKVADGVLLTRVVVGAN